MSNKKVLLFTGILLFLFIINLIYAQESSVQYDEKYKEDMRIEICKNYTAFYQRNEPIEEFVKFVVFPINCPCVRYKSESDNYEWVSEYARSDYSIERGNNYCYTKSPRSVIGSVISPKGSKWNGYDKDFYPGQIRECTDDQDTKYQTINGFERKRNMECPVTSPFCNEYFLCNECIEDDDCDIRAKQQMIKEVTNSVCKESKYSHAGRLMFEKTCSYCQKISGNGDIIITIIGDLSINKAESLVNNLTKIQPYKYLNEEGRFKFNYVRTDLSLFVFTGFHSSKTLNDTRNLISEICGNADIYIFYDDSYYPASYYNTALDIIYIKDESASMEYNEPIALAHEIGHAFAKLGDEYVINDREKYKGYEDTLNQFTGPNLDNSKCNKFQIVDKFNCFNIKGIDFLDNQGKYKFVIENLYKSTTESIMCNSWKSSKFNIVSCAAILEKAGESKENALKLCKKMACEKEVIKQSETIC